MAPSLSKIWFVGSNGLMGRTWHEMIVEFGHRLGRITLWYSFSGEGSRQVVLTNSSSTCYLVLCIPIKTSAERWLLIKSFNFCKTSIVLFLRRSGYRCCKMTLLESVKNVQNHSIEPKTRKSLTGLRFHFSRAYHRRCSGIGYSPAHSHSN